MCVYIQANMVLQPLYHHLSPLPPSGAVLQPEQCVWRGGAPEQARAFHPAVGRAGRPELLRVGADAAGDGSRVSARHRPPRQALRLLVVPRRRSQSECR
jgi:hypothetical protein